MVAVVSTEALPGAGRGPSYNQLDWRVRPPFSFPSYHLFVSSDQSGSLRNDPVCTLLVPHLHIWNWYFFLPLDFSSPFLFLFF